MTDLTLGLNDLTPFEGEEPRVHDMLLAERLGYDRPTSVRVLIRKHVADLERYGALHQADAKSRGGRPGREFWLNEGQALRLCTLSGTEKAAEITHQVIAVYQAWRMGGVAKRMSPSEVMEMMQEAVARQEPSMVDAIMTAIAPIMGRVVKSVAGKQIAEMEARIETKIDGKIEEVLGGHDGRRNWAIDFKSMRTVLNDEGVPSKKRRGLSTQCSNSCAKWSKRNRRESQWKYEAGGDDSKRIFHVDLIRDWLTMEGRAIILAHQDRIKGQGTLSFIAAKRGTR